MKNIIFGLFLFSASTILAQTPNFNAEDLLINPLIEGTLIVPESQIAIPLVIIIAGSGPTDRNGNQQMAKNNSLKFLAEELYEKNIASFRYDKRIIMQMKKGILDEKSIRFNDFIIDAVDVAQYFKTDERFSKIYIIGHSEGSLIGMVAAQSSADGFISLAGAGQPIDNVIVYQIGKQAPGLKENAQQAFDELRANGGTQNYSIGLHSIFRPDLQPYMLSWMKYNPQEEISKLKIPVLIVNGDKDIQVEVSEAELLKSAKPDAEYKIIPNMNHIFKEIAGNDLENSKSYNQYDTPVMPELIETISAFINEK